MCQTRASGRQIKLWGARRKKKKMIRIPVTPSGFVELPRHLAGDRTRVALVDAPGSHAFEMRGCLLDATHGIYSCGGMIVHAPGSTEKERVFYVSDLENVVPPGRKNARKKRGVARVPRTEDAATEERVS